MKRLAVVAFCAILGGCRLFEGADPRPMVAVLGQERELFLQMASSYESLIQESNATPEVKGAYKAAIAKARSQMEALHESGVRWVIEAHSITAKELFDQLSEIWKKWEAKP